MLFYVRMCVKKTCHYTLVVAPVPVHFRPQCYTVKQRRSPTKGQCFAALRRGRCVTQHMAWCVV